MEKKWRAILEQIKEKNKFPKKNQLFLLLLTGILLVVIAWPVSDKEEEESRETDISALTEAGVSSAEAYEEYLERRVASALEYVEGVGKAEVVITLKSSGQKVIEKDQNTSSQMTEEADSNGGTRTTEDNSSGSTSVYEHQSDGTQIPYVSMELTPEIEGVLIIAEGGDNAVVIRNITEAIQALFGVEAHKIKIMKRTDT